MCGKNIIRLWLNVLLELVLIHYYFAHLVTYNCRNMFVSVGNMLVYIMYQSFLNCEFLCFDKKDIVYCVWPTFNILYLEIYIMF